MLLPLLLSVFIAPPSASQDSAKVVSAAPQITAAQRHLWEEISLWQHTNNAAGLMFDVQPMVARGESAFSFGQAHSDLRNVQQGSSQQLGAFHAQQQLPVTRWLIAQGSFTYGLSQYRQRAWADRSDNSELVLSTAPYALYNIGATNLSSLSPLNAGSDQLGRYDAQTVEMDFRLGTRTRSSWKWGLAMNYRVNDLARLKDPRSRAKALHYRIAPAVVYAQRWGRIGASAWYARHKEKIDNVTSVQNDAQWNYFTLEGLERITGGVGAYQGFMRQWVDHKLGGELLFNGQYGAMTTLTSVSFERNKEEAVGNNRYAPADFLAQTLQVRSLGRIRTAQWWHTWHNEVTWQRGFTNERQQNLVLTTDPNTKIVSRHYETLLDFRKRYQVERVAAGISYRALRVGEPQPSRWNKRQFYFSENQYLDAFVGVAVLYDYLSQNYLLPSSSRETQRLKATLEGGKLWSNHLWTGLEIGTSFALQHDLQLAQPKSVLAPLWQQQHALDQQHMSFAALNLRYDFPLQLRGQSLRCFARANGSYATAWEKGQSGTSFLFTLGLLH